FSYHGLPESQMKKVSPTCLRSPDCCLQANSCEKNCYRAQSLKTTELIAKKLQLKPEQYSSSFQSRLGPVQWIKPYTDDTIVALGKKGIRKLAVVCPSFVTDCIETLEEIGIEGKHLFEENGGTEFTLLTCLNSRADWRKKFSTHLLGQCGEDKSMQRELN
ncbi:MAG: ferrochelatase, partial [Pseudobdellovibrionaceae bacterium]